MKHTLLISASLFYLLFFNTGIGFAQGTNNGATVTVNSGTATSEFDQYFIPKTLRVDFTMAGKKDETTVYLSGMKMEPNYGGPRKSLLDPFDYGTYRITATDSASGKMIFSKGFCNLFQEWQQTAEAKRLRKAFDQVAVIPFPKKAIIFRVEKRSVEDGLFHSLFETNINPKDYFIYRGEIKKFPVVKFRDSGEPQDKVDVAFIAEGYSQDQMPKFLADAKRMSDSILGIKPYSDYPDRFNFYAIESPSDESGVTVPGKGTYANTAVHSNFYTFDMDRYLTTSDARDIYDIAANVPYDVIFILVNSKTYGGGGFYNYYAESTADNVYAAKVAVHEFGHAFAGLADEYIDLTISYTDFYNPKIEPWEPNITDTVDFGSKWKNLLTPGVQIPTPETVENEDATGLFEGAGYVEKGFFRSAEDCRMRTNEARGFCPACREAIRKMIIFYSE
jgi:hypothetical protein